MGLLLLIPGLILLLAGSGWFAGAATVGIILTVIGVVMLVIQLIVTFLLGRKIRDLNRSIESDMRRMKF